MRHMEMTASLAQQLDVTLDHVRLGFHRHAAQSELESRWSGMDRARVAGRRYFGVLDQRNGSFPGSAQSLAHDLISGDRSAIVAERDRSRRTQGDEIGELLSTAAYRRSRDRKDIDHSAARR